MLPTKLLIHRYHGDEIKPKRLELNKESLDLAEDVISIFHNCHGLSRKELDEQLQVLEGEHTNYRIKRGLAHILSNSFATFDIKSPLDPVQLREAVFRHSAQIVPSPEASARSIAELAQSLSLRLEREVSQDEISAGLYADLPENRIMTEFEAVSAENLIHRYNLSQVQGILYRAHSVVITAQRNDPGEYKMLFKYLKLFRLMSYIEGDADHGFSITIDGPNSLFKPSTRYGIDLAKLLPALLHVTRWSMVAELIPKRSYDDSPKATSFRLDHTCDLVSHYPPGKAYDSMLEQAFASRWEKTKTEWQLEREVDLIPIPGSVMVPDFRLVHPDGRSFLMEIIGYWRPEYLKKKFAQIRKADRQDIILAVSERLNLAQAGVNIQDLMTRVVWFKNKLQPKDILSVIPTSAPGP